jgi:hypothetical protein
MKNNKKQQRQVKSLAELKQIFYPDNPFGGESAISDGANPEFLGIKFVEQAMETLRRECVRVVHCNKG